MTREHCNICDQEVEGVGPWCMLYCGERHLLCQPFIRAVHVAREMGDERSIEELLIALGRADKRLDA